MLLAFVAIVVITIGAEAVLERSGYSSAERATGTAVRLDAAKQP